MNRNLPNMY